jgi:hypothetical protein
LLTLLAFASRIEPGLLRAVRRLLPVQEADAGTEADAWAHPDVAGGFAPSAGMTAELRRRLQSRFLAEKEEVRRAVVAIQRTWRAGLPREIWLEEIFALDVTGAAPEGALSADEIAEARALWRGMATSLDEESGADPATQQAVGNFARRSLRDRAPEAVWDDAEMSPVLFQVWKAVQPKEGEQRLPPGAGPGLFGGGGEPRRWQIVQVGSTIRCVPPGRRPDAGSPLGEIETSNGLIGLGLPGTEIVARPVDDGAPLDRAVSRMGERRGSRPVRSVGQFRGRRRRPADAVDSTGSVLDGISGRRARQVGRRRSKTPRTNPARFLARGHSVHASTLEGRHGQRA